VFGQSFGRTIESNQTCITHPIHHIFSILTADGGGRHSKYQLFAKLESGLLLTAIYYRHSSCIIMMFVHPMLRMGSFVSALTVVRGFSGVQPLQSRVVLSSSLSSSSSSTTSLSMVKTRGLEQRKEGATPTGV
jgi:hypothetical protein